MREGNKWDKSRKKELLKYKKEKMNIAFFSP